MTINGYEYNVRMTPEEFVLSNEDYFTHKYLEENPNKSYKINDGDLEDMYDSIDYDEVISDMLDCYNEVLRDNL